MKICGFTFVRNAVKFDYPVVESIRSILPIVDQFIVCLGNSEDDTQALIESIGSPKIKIKHSVWDESLKRGGQVLAVETNKALSYVPAEYTWAFYLQADEVVHEKDREAILAAANQYAGVDAVQGLLFNYIHFYGTYDYVGDSRRWYQHEIRLIKNNNTITSYRDAQGFRTKQNKKLSVKKLDAEIYHYGWVRNPRTQLEKNSAFYTFWNGSDYVPGPLKENEQFDYANEADSVERFKGTHPAVMHRRISEKNYPIRLDSSKKKFSLKDRLLYYIEKQTGRRILNYRNYKII